MTRRRLAWGGMAAAAYVAVALALVGAGRPVLPLFDGLAPQAPYRWVTRPEGVRGPSQPPLPGSATVPMEENSALTVITEDAQAQLSALTDSLVLAPGQEELSGELTPLDPATLGPPPPGRRFDSNAYEAMMTYLPSGDPVEITANVTVLLRYARHATRIHRWTGSRWAPLQTTVLDGTLQVFANTREMGIFVATGPETSPPDGGIGWPLWVAYGAGGLAVLVGLELFLRRRRRARRRSARRRR